MKKNFSIPFILPLSGGDSGEIGGYGSSQSGSNPVPMSYNDWVNSQFATDYNHDGNCSFEEYGYWWLDCGFDEEAWGEYNPNEPFPED